MNRKVAVLGILVAIGLSGCATEWSLPPGISEAQYYRDRLECKQTANNLYPVQMVTVGPATQFPAQTNCTTFNNQTNCTSQPGAYIPPGQIDSNLFRRPQAFSECLRSRGYTPR